MPNAVTLLASLTNAKLFDAFMLQHEAHHIDNMHMLLTIALDRLASWDELFAVRDLLDKIYA